MSQTAALVLAVALIDASSVRAGETSPPAGSKSSPPALGGRLRGTGATCPPNGGKPLTTIELGLLPVVEQHIAKGQATIDDYVLRGRARYRQGDFKGAAADYSSALLFDPHSEPILQARTLAKMCGGDDAGALRDLDLLVAAHPDNAGGFLAGRANARLLVQQYDGALADFARLIELEPQNSTWREGRVDCLLKAERYPDALAEAERFVAAFPDAPAAYFRRGSAHLVLGQFAEAIRDYDETLRRSPADVEARRLRDEAAAKLHPPSPAAPK